MRWVIKYLLVFLLFYGAGFVLFVRNLPEPFTTLPDEVEALAVFTGGEGRIEAVLEMMGNGFKGPVLISGVHRDVRLGDLLMRSTRDDLERQQIKLDYEAETTRQNVQNTLYWATQNKLENIGVVTSAYHIMRCRILFWLVAPQREIIFLPVQPIDGGWRTLWREYNKLILAPLLA